ncbi:hypothetical protein ABZ626_03580 [Streptomyces longispororuber]|uniref:hypothetical protein n=1 Tax=Streptomyces longispororuber TaxID=68230 RepID=UPI00340DEAD8
MSGLNREQPKADEKTTHRRCHCLIAHAQNENEKARAKEALDNALKTNDAHAVYIACLQLLAPCPARDGQETR